MCFFATESSTVVDGVEFNYTFKDFNYSRKCAENRFSTHMLPCNVFKMMFFFFIVLISVDCDLRSGVGT